MGIKQSLIECFPILQRVQSFVYRVKSYKTKFTAYYKTTGWNCQESKSGPGSTLGATERLREALPTIFSRYGVHSILDVPCGDFNWMKHVCLDGITYTGGDIVDEMIADNQRKYGRENVHFVGMDLMKSRLPTADLMICRDCLFHYPNEFVLKGLRLMADSGCTYLLTSTFPQVAVNEKLYATGWFRPINLEAAPFNLSAPLTLIVEEEDRQKCMGLWLMEDVRKVLNAFPQKVTKITKA